MIGAVSFLTYFLEAQPTVKGMVPAIRTASIERRVIVPGLLHNFRLRPDHTLRRRRPLCRWFGLSTGCANSTLNVVSGLDAPDANGRRKSDRDRKFFTGY